MKKIIFMFIIMIISTGCQLRDNNIFSEKYINTCWVHQPDEKYQTYAEYVLYKEKFIYKEVDSREERITTGKWLCRREGEIIFFYDDNEYWNILDFVVRDFSTFPVFMGPLAKDISVFNDKNKILGLKIHKNQEGVEYFGFLDYYYYRVK